MRSASCRAAETMAAASPPVTASMSSVTAGGSCVAACADSFSRCGTDPGGERGGRQSQTELIQHLLGLIALEPIGHWRQRVTDHTGERFQDA